MTEKVYRVGIIGCGRITSTIDDEIDFATYEVSRAPLCHAGGYQEVPRTEMVAAADVIEGKLQAFGQRWGVAHLYSDYEEMLTKEDLDIVSIGTRPQHHADITDNVDHERLHAGIRRRAATVVKADQRVRGKPDEGPADYKE